MVKIKAPCEACLNKNCFIKQNCSKEELKNVSDNKIMNRYAKSRHIFHEGNDADCIYFIYSGIVKVFKSGALNKDRILRFPSNGNILGHRGFNSSKLYPVSAQAVNDVVICSFSKEYFFKLLDEVPQLAINLMLFYADELNQEEINLSDTAVFNVREKVAKALINLIDKFGLDDNEKINNIELLSRQDIADCVGLTANQVVKILGEFNKDELIKITGKKIMIPNRLELEEIIKF